MCPITHDACFTRAIAKTLKLALYLSHRHSWAKTPWISTFGDIRNLWCARHPFHGLCTLSHGSLKWQHVSRRLLSSQDLFAIACDADERLKSRLIRNILSISYELQHFPFVFCTCIKFLVKLIAFYTLCYLFLLHGHDHFPQPLTLIQ